MAVVHHLKDMFNLSKDRSAFFTPSPDAETVVSPARAMEIFDTLKNMKHLAYGYTDDGCYARAHLMCRQILDMNAVPQKAWAFETEKRDLVVNYPEGDQIWWFHVAPVLKVDNGKGGHVAMVLDPSLFDGPATVKEWREVMKAEANQVFIVDCGAAPKGYTGDYTPFHRTGWTTDAKAEKLMFDYVPLQGLNGGMPTVFPSRMRAESANDAVMPQTRFYKGAAACPNPKA